MLANELTPPFLDCFSTNRDAELQKKEEVVKAFANLYYQLGEGNRIEGAAINSLISFIHPYLHLQNIRFYVKEFGNGEKVKPMVYSNFPTNKYPVICIPDNYLKLVDDDPIQQLGNIADVLSRCKDFILQLILLDSRFEGIDARAAAYESDVYVALKKFSDEDSENVVFSQTQLDLMKKYPNGYIGLDGSLKYELTSMYTPPVQ